MLKLRDLFTPSEKAILFPDVVFNGVTLEGSSSENGPKSCRHLLPFFLSFFQVLQIVLQYPHSIIYPYDS